jgi:hypothetical protein
MSAESKTSHKGGPKISESTKHIKLLVSGAIAGIVSRTATAPIERVKLLRQTNNVHYKGKSMLESFKFMIQKEGPLGAFKGNGANVVKIGPFSALEFFTYDFLRGKLLGDQPLTFSR